MGLSFTQWFSVRGDSTPQGTSGNVWRHFGMSQRGGETGTSIHWAEDRDAAKQSVMHRTAPTTRDHPAPNINCAKIENPTLTNSVASIKYIWEHFSSQLQPHGFLPSQYWDFQRPECAPAPSCHQNPLWWQKSIRSPLLRIIGETLAFSA